jgi:negative regulator of flagellin synthesis FlgM
VLLRNPIAAEQEQAMSSVNSVGGNLPVEPVSSVDKQSPVSTLASQAADRKDSVELSSVSQWMSALHDNNIRADKVAEVRAQIQAGSYETDQKMNAAAEGLLNDIQS